MAKTYEIVTVPKNEIVVYQPNETLIEKEVVSKMETTTHFVYGKKRDVQLASSRYQQQYPNHGLALTQWSNAHDRFIVCDNTVWICGSSIKDAGRRMFALVKTGLRPEAVLSALPVGRKNGFHGRCLGCNDML